MQEKEENNLMEKIISLSKRRGFIYQGSEVYGGLAGTWDYGPLGVSLKNNIKNLWWKKFVDSRTDMYGVDAAILMNSEVWKKSGHVDTFSDPLVECTKCKKRFRADQLIENEEDFKKVKIAASDLIRKWVEDSKNELNDAKKLIKPIEDISNFDLKDNEKDELFKAFSPIINQISSVLVSAEEKVEKSNNLFDEIIKSNKYIGFLVKIYLDRHILCPEKNCKAHSSWSVPRDFNMMFKTQIGAVEDSSATVYLRPETAQGMFVNFKNIVDSFHPKLPFGMAQIGKAFRNEITPRDFIFRVREFEQMEIEFYLKEEDWQKYFEYWKSEMFSWMDQVGIDMSKVHELEVEGGDLAHYSKRTVDFEFDFPFGRKELYGLAYRTNFDLNNHGLSYQDEETSTRIVPHVVEPTFGVDRTVLAVMLSSYKEDTTSEEVRPYLAFKPSVAPVICAVSPLLKNKVELRDYAHLLYRTLKDEFGRVMWDDNGNIGKRYRRQDEIGTPWCIVVDFDTLTDDTVTIRDRDTGTQERIKKEDIVGYIKEKMN